MKGTVLGYDPATMKGVINGEDGSRYEFAVAEWKGGGVPGAGAKVDFNPVGGEATGVYPAVAASGGPSIDGAEIGRLFMTRPPIAGAIAMILGCLLPVYSVSVSMMGMGGVSQSVNLFRISDGLGLLFWAAPIMAGVVLYFEFAKRDAGATPRNILMGAGGAGVGAPILVWLLGDQMISGQTGGIASATISPSIGAFIVIAGGALILLNAFGVVRSFGAPPQT